jgi:uncharacterized integral membrane protein (TIGR00698 family)
LLLPGLGGALILAWLSVRLSTYLGTSLLGFDRTPISAVMLAMLLGLAIGSLVRVPSWLEPGLRFAVKKVLRLGIILLGIRLTVFDVLQLGAAGLPIVVLCIASALLVTTRANRWLRLPDRLGTLIAVGTSICGVSAIVATGPAIEAEDKEVAYAVAVVTIFGLMATVIYPFLANAIFSGDPHKVGLFLGTSVHDTSQVVGSAKVFADVFSAPRALDVATVTKLVRNVFMVAVIPFMAFRYGRRTREAGGDEKVGLSGLVPLFVVGFLFMAVARSVGDAGIRAGGSAFGLWQGAEWAETYGLVKTWAGNLLVVALAGVGLSTDFRAFRTLGIKPFLVGLSSALAVGAVSFLAIFALGRAVVF